MVVSCSSAKYNPFSSSSSAEPVQRWGAQGGCDGAGSHRVRAALPVAARQQRAGRRLRGGGEQPRGGIQPRAEIHGPRAQPATPRRHICLLRCLRGLHGHPSESPALRFDRIHLRTLTKQTCGVNNLLRRCSSWQGSRRRRTRAAGWAGTGA